MKITIILEGTVDDWLDLENFLKRRRMKYSSILSKIYRNLIAVAWITQGFRKGKFAGLSLEEAMNNTEALVEDDVKMKFKNVNIILEVNLPESEVLSLYAWYEKRRETREQMFKVTLSGKLKRAIQKLLDLPYGELAPFEVSVIGEDTYVTLIWNILGNSELSQQDRNWLAGIAPRKSLSVEESMLLLKYHSRGKPLRSVLRK